LFIRKILPMLKVKVIDVTLTEMMVLGILTELSFLFVETD